MLRQYNFNVKHITIKKSSYSEHDCLKQIKSTGAIGVKNNIKNTFLHREYSMFCGMKHCFDMIDSNIHFDYVCISRLDWGINEINNLKHTNVVDLLNSSIPEIICGHLNGSIDRENNNLSTDPRFVLGKYKHMQFFSDLPELFLNHVRERKLCVDRVMHDHAFISYVINNKLQYIVLSLHEIFSTIAHKNDKIIENHKINLSNEEEKRIKVIYDRINLQS